MLNSSPTGGQITYSVQKKLNPVEKLPFFIQNYFSKAALLIFIFTWPLDYQKQKKLLQGSVFYIWVYKSGGKRLAVVG